MLILIIFPLRIYLQLLILTLFPQIQLKSKCQGVLIIMWFALIIHTAECAIELSWAKQSLW